MHTDRVYEARNSSCSFIKTRPVFLQQTRPDEKREVVFFSPYLLFSSNIISFLFVKRPLHIEF